MTIGTTSSAPRSVDAPPGFGYTLPEMAAAIAVLLVTGEQRTYARQDRFDSAGIRSVRVPGAARFVMHDAPEALLTALEDPAP